MTLAERIKKRKAMPVPRSIAFRYELRQGAAPGGPLDKAFLRELALHFPRYEFIYDPLLKGWLLYEVTIYGGCPSDDKMYLRAQVRKPMESPTGERVRPGRWLLDYLRNPANTLEAALDHNLLIYEQKDKEFSELADAIARDMAPGLVGRTSLGMVDGKPVGRDATVNGYRPAPLPKKKGKVFRLDLDTGAFARVA